MKNYINVLYLEISAVVSNEIEMRKGNDGLSDCICAQLDGTGHILFFESILGWQLNRIMKGVKVNRTWSRK